MKKASKRRILFAARMATMVGAACFAVSGISETLGQEKEKSRPVYIATEEVAETTYMPEVEETTQPTETAKAVETEEPLIASMDWDKDDSYLLCKIAMAEAESEGVKGKALKRLILWRYKIMKMKLMTPEAIKEIESLIPDHEEALMRWGAQMYREGIVKGAILVGTGLILRTIAGVVKELYFDSKNRKSEEES